MRTILGKKTKTTKKKYWVGAVRQKGKKIPSLNAT